MDDLDCIVAELSAKGAPKPEPPKIDKDKYWENYKGEDRIIDSDEALKLVAENKKYHIAINSGIKKLDDLLGGFVGGELIVSTGITSHGKTLLAQSITHNMAQANVCVLWFSYEVPMEQLLNKFEAMKGDPNDKIDLFFMPAKNEANSVDWIESKFKESRAKSLGTKVVFIDHLDYVVPFVVGYNRADIIGETMRRLKTLAIQYNYIIFLLAHVQKISDDKDPEISSIRSSSYIGQESDTILYTKRIIDFEKEANDTELYVLKNRRKGSVGMIKMVYDNGVLREKTEDEIAYEKNKGVL
jgi:replicative DNA helicase